MKQKILVVDDSSTARMLFRVCLMDNSRYEILEAPNWKTALDLAKSQHPFMIVLDYNMPEKTGDEVAKILQKAGVKGHYVLITANTQQSILNKVKELNFFDILEKPVSAESIQCLLEKLP